MVKDSGMIWTVNPLSRAVCAVIGPIQAMAILLTRLDFLPFKKAQEIKDRRRNGEGQAINGPGL